MKDLRSMEDGVALWKDVLVKLASVEYTSPHTIPSPSLTRNDNSALLTPLDSPPDIPPPIPTKPANYSPIPVNSRSPLPSQPKTQDPTFNHSPSLLLSSTEDFSEPHLSLVDSPLQHTPPTHKTPPSLHTPPNPSAVNKNREPDTNTMLNHRNSLSNGSTPNTEVSFFLTLN